ncbi:type II toxin-antitoxin system HicA family toxin [bacterium]|nr:type II toxin-antitoxin system HicA family toxin [bacterium]
MKAQKFVKILLKLNFVKRDAEGFHVFFRHSNGRITVIPIHNKEISRGLLRKILHDIQLSVEEYDKLRKEI